MLRESINSNGEGRSWSRQTWTRLECETRERALSRQSDEEAWEVIVRAARVVLKNYSTSFFMVTRFLPPLKRSKVEAVYAAVRYPDEIVDSFPLDAGARTEMLDRWGARYEDALRIGSVKGALEAGVPCFLASFVRVVIDSGIPFEHYRSFLDAMRLDARPRPFADLEDLIESYVYGSAVVVGYFLSHIYGPSSPECFNRTLFSARSLGIALQLTNFLRDVAEDDRRGRLYLPLDMLREAGIDELDLADPGQLNSLNGVLARIAAIAENHYEAARRNLDAFAPDTRTAIQACIDVYRQLNLRIARRPSGILKRQSVPISQKFRVLPPSKYWRLPLAYLLGN